MPANRTKSGQFKRGFSGNPAGRPKRSETEKATLEAVCGLAPHAVAVLQDLLMDETTPAAVRLKCASIILERVCGKPMDADHLEDYEEKFRFDIG